MQSIFRIYAKTTKQNDKYLYNELLSLGLQPKYEDLMHAFYFNANFNQIFKLSFQGFTVESLYVQLGHRYPLSMEVGENEKSVGQFLRKINFRNYLPLQRGIIENTTLKLLIRESSTHLPSQNAIISIFQNYLQKQIIMKEYRKMVKDESNFNRLENYYDIKQIVEKKWGYEDQGREERGRALIQGKEMERLIGRGRGRGNEIKLREQQNDVQEYEEHRNQLADTFQVPYSPHFLMYIRRNHARLLLKLNTSSMHKFGWKKSIGWGPIRQTLTASILYRTGLLPHFLQTKQMTLWDPFCGSGTIPLVALSMLKSLKVRTEKDSFVWDKWPIFREGDLKLYLEDSRRKNRETQVRILASDIDVAAVRNCVGNFGDFVNKNRGDLAAGAEETGQNFLNIKPGDQIYQILPNSVYIGCGDFQTLAQTLLKPQSQSQSHPISILTNLPYLGQRSKQHHPLNQLHSIYRRFNSMIEKYKDSIENVFVIVDADMKNSNHFVRVSKLEWRILEYFGNGGIEVVLLGWVGNRVGWGEVVGYEEKGNTGVIAYTQEKKQNLEEYRQQVKQLQNKRYKLPAHLDKKEGLTKSKRVIEKRRVRHLAAAYEIFAKRKDKNQTYQKYARKKLALKLSVRGKTWKRKNISIVGKQIEGKEQVIKKQFENRIEEALKRSQQMKLRKKGIETRPKRKW